MTTNWKYTDATNTVVSRMLDSGEIESCAISVITDWITAGNNPDNSDPLSPAQQQINIESAIQKALDLTAQTCNYDNIKSACSYASTMPWVPDTDPNFAMCEKFRRQGNYAQNRMSLTWAMCYAYLATVQAGTNPIPTPAEAIAMMPEFIWPD